MEDMLSSRTRLPIIYTTRLEDMKIFRKDSGRQTFKNLIEAVIIESKPHHMDVHDKVYISKINKAKKIFFTNLTLKGNNNLGRNRGITFSSSTRKSHSRQRKILKEVSKSGMRLEVKKRSNSRVVIKPEKVLVPELQINHLKLRNFLAFCKPLQVILTDIMKYPPKKVDAENEFNDLCIINHADNNRDRETQSKTDIEDGNQPMYEFKNCEEIFTPSRTLTEDDPSLSHIIKSVSSFKKILESDDIKNSTIVVYNIFAKELDAYEIDENYNVTDFIQDEYTQLCKFEMKKCKSIIQIIVCCWENRRSYITLLHSYKNKYAIIAHYMHRQHPCKVCACKCCCYLSEDSSIEPQNGFNNVSSINNDPSKVIRNMSSNSSLPLSDTQNSKLIQAALKYPFRSKKEEKWNETRQPMFVRNKENYKHECKSLVNLSRKRSVDLYELGPDFVVYSKVLNEALDDSKWLSKTLNSGRLEMRYKNSSDIGIAISFSSYFKRPLSEEIVQTRYTNNQLKYPDLQSECKVEHLRRFINNQNQKSKIESILPYIHSSESLVSNNVVMTEPKKHTEESVSPIVNALINDILHRFRDVRLTINAEGKISATLNAPLSSLSSPELRIFSEILTRAQDQVNKLCLTPGTCLKLDTPVLSIPNSLHSGINSINTHVNLHKFQDVNTKNKITNITEMTDKKKINKGLTKDISKNINLDIASETENGEKVYIEKTKDHIAENKVLSSFSRIISEKKKNYEESFKNLIGNRSLLIPKITNIFSLNPSILSSNSKDNVNKMCNKSKRDFNSSVEVKPSTSTETYLETNKQQDTLNKTGIANGRKHKTSSESETVPTKIKMSKIADSSFEAGCQPSS